MGNQYEQMRAISTKVFMDDGWLGGWLKNIHMPRSQAGRSLTGQRYARFTLLDRRHEHEVERENL